jgi:hypothetical protein
MLTTSLVLLATRRVLRSPVILSNTHSTQIGFVNAMCLGHARISVPGQNKSEWSALIYMLDMRNNANHATFRLAPRIFDTHPLSCAIALLLLSLSLSLTFRVALSEPEARRVILPACAARPCTQPHAQNA